VRAGGRTGLDRLDQIWHLAVLTHHSLIVVGDDD